jgi:hypothetical protein
MLNVLYVTYAVGFSRRAVAQSNILSCRTKGQHYCAEDRPQSHDVEGLLYFE